MPEIKESEVDVLIVGAGSTGLVLALELARQFNGIHRLPFSFRIIDKAFHTCPLAESRAFLVHARTLELLARHDIPDTNFTLTDDLRSRGEENFAMRISVNKIKVIGIELGGQAGSDTMFSSPLLVGQGEIESVLQNHLGSLYATRVERGTRALSIEHNEAGATVWLEKLEKDTSLEESSSKDRATEKVRCKFVVGCDGSHSIVRKTANLAFIGDPYPQDFVLADVRLDLTDVPHEVQLYLGSSGFAGVVPIGKDNEFRLICSRNSEQASDTEPRIEDFEKVLADLSPFKFKASGPPRWITIFHLHHRIVESYRKERLFLAGDAAHVHSPVGGQGLNTGIQDAVNLGWKLATAVRLANAKPGVDEVLLDSYNIERHRVGEKLLNGTDKAFEILSTNNWLMRWIRNFAITWLAPLILRSPVRRAEGLRYLSGLAIRYRNCGSPLVGQTETWMGVFKSGDRLPDGRVASKERDTMWLHTYLRQPGWHLLFFGGSREARGYRMLMDDVFEEFNLCVFHLDSDTCKLILSGTFNPSDNLAGRVNNIGLIDQGDRLHRSLGLEQGGFVLVRPDLYVSFICDIGEFQKLQKWVLDVGLF